MRVFLTVATLLAFAASASFAEPRPVSCGDPNHLLSISGSVESDVLTADIKIMMGGQAIVDVRGVRYARPAPESGGFFALMKDPALDVVKDGTMYFIPTFLDLGQSPTNIMYWVPVLDDDGGKSPILLRTRVYCSALP